MTAGTLDWNLARSRGPEAQGPAWEPEVCSRIGWQRGGAALLVDLIEGVAAQIRGHAAYEIRQPASPRRTATVGDTHIGPEDPRFHHSCASWLSYPYATAKGFRKGEAGLAGVGVPGLEPLLRFGHPQRLGAGGE